MNTILNKISIRDNKWIWPIYDEATFQRQKNENGLFNIINPLLKHKRLMIQAGGNCGMSINQFVSEFSSIFTFEPDPLNFYCLRQNLPYEHVTTFQACLGNKHAMVSLQRGKNSKGENEVGAVYINNTNKNLVPVLKIDDFNFPYCDLIQLDVEGYELQALLGGYLTIKKYKPVLCIEWFEKWSERYGNTRRKINTFFYDLGYKRKATYLSDEIYECK